ncbi:hypothetical protein ACJVC5_16730 [Peredibacter sp. HCB2-198]|uniref:hypothetical protein n=1 Tax=Peredibacter sp. HCB2-198 TaxID=3383025 RepID=UPI0038B60725
MKKLSLVLSLVTGTAFAHLPLHLDLEMTSVEYESLLRAQAGNKKFQIDRDDPAITSTIKLGARLSKWIALVNENRSGESAIRLTSPTTRRGIPIDKPNVYSPSIIAKEVAQTLEAMPGPMREVIVGNGDLPTTTTLDDETFILHARKLDRNYQSAARYKSVDAYRSEYKRAAAQDVRGYYYLTQNKIGAEELKDVAQIPTDKLPEIRDALYKICRNTPGTSQRSCEKALERAFKNNTLSEYYSNYFAKAQKNWDNFFLIPSGGRRSDIKWYGTYAVVPFNTPEIPKFIPYLRNNIEDEFRWADWSLKMEFGSFRNGPRLKFEPGVVPHVNGLGGNEIVMDSNQPIEEYESQWTIRHEFGHVLGLPDCYHEFYDEGLQAYVNYQLDITDLMCSRAGNMKERIYEEIKKAYDR